MADTVYRKTEAGRLAFKQRGDLTPRQRTAFILFDGVRGTREVLAAAAGMGATAEDVRVMLERGLLERVSGNQGVIDSAFAPALDVTLDHDDSAAVVKALAAGQANTPPPTGNVPASAPVAAAAAVAPTGGRPQALTEEQMRERYKMAYPIAVALTSSLGLRGFRLNLAVEAAGGYGQLVELLPRMREALGPVKLAALEEALGTKG